MAHEVDLLAECPNRSLSNWREQYYAESYARLVDVKTHYDGGNLFTNPQRIPPREL